MSAKHAGQMAAYNTVTMAARTLAARTLCSVPALPCTHGALERRVARSQDCSTSGRKLGFNVNRRVHTRRAGHFTTCRADAGSATEAQSETYQGMFGEWSIDKADEAEVARYRAGLTIAASAAALGSLMGLIAGTEGVFGRIEDLVAFVGAAGLGVSLYEIHIYVSPLKRFIQGLWAVGALSALILAATQDGPVVHQVVTNSATVWGVGPLFAAITGVAFKEGMCYGKAEAAALFFVTPTLLLGHLTGGMPEGVQQALLLLFVGIFGVFAGRKFTQAVKDDIGDKSVFEFQKLAPEQQEEKLELMRQRMR